MERMQSAASWPPRFIRPGDDLCRKLRPFLPEGAILPEDAIYIFGMSFTQWDFILAVVQSVAEALDFKVVAFREQEEDGGSIVYMNASSGYLDALGVGSRCVVALVRRGKVLEATEQVISPASLRNLFAFSAGRFSGRSLEVDG